MKNLGIAALILLVAVGAFWRLRYHGRPAVHTHTQKVAADPASMYRGLRNQMLQGSRAKFGLPAASNPTQPWAALMEMGLSRGSATVVAVSDGTTCIYLSSGGGYIGGGQQYEAIRNAGQHLLHLAGQYQPLMHSTQESPLPHEGQIIFYAVTDSGVFTAEAPERDLVARHDWLGSLYAAGQDIITQYRLISPSQ